MFYLTQKLDYDNDQQDNNNDEKGYYIGSPKDKNGPQDYYNEPPNSNKEPPNYNNGPPNYNNGPPNYNIGPQYDNNRQNDYNRKAILIIMDTTKRYSLYDANYFTLLDLTIFTRC